jgi:hypothetical protein
MITNTNKTKYNKNLTIFSILVIVTLLLNSTMVFATQTSTSEKIDIKLLNQNPDPVKPGELVELRFSLKNEGKSSSDSYIFEIEPKYPFTLFDEATATQEIGYFPAFQKNSDIKIVKSKLKVAESVNDGSYDISVQIYKKGSDVKIKKDFTIEVKGSPNAEISSISIQNLIPGKKTQVDFEVKNVGKTALRNLMFEWESTADIILPLGSSNVKYIDEIKPSESVYLSYDVVTNANTKPGLYKLDMTLTYDDIESIQTITQAGTIKDEKRKEIKSKSGIYIGGTTDFKISYKNTKAPNEYVFSIANIGNSKADSITVEINNSELNMIGSETNIVGNLNKGDYSITEFAFAPENYNKDLFLDLVITYTASNGERSTMNKKVKIPKNGLKYVEESMNIEQKKSKSWIYIVLILGVIGYFTYKKIKKKKTAKKKQK